MQTLAHYPLETAQCHTCAYPWACIRTAWTPEEGHLNTCTQGPSECGMDPSGWSGSGQGAKRLNYQKVKNSCLESGLSGFYEGQGRKSEQNSFNNLLVELYLVNTLTQYTGFHSLPLPGPTNSGAHSNHSWIIWLIATPINLDRKSCSLR